MTPPSHAHRIRQPDHTTHAKRRIRPRTWLLAGTALALALMACRGESYLQPLQTQLNFLQFQSRELSFRYTDFDGQPIIRGRVQCGIEGSSGGAVLENLVVLTDEQGLARFTLNARYAAFFRVVCQADGADPVTVYITVA